MLLFSKCNCPISILADPTFQHCSNLSDAHFSSQKPAETPLPCTCLLPCLMSLLSIVSIHSCAARVPSLAQILCSQHQVLCLFKSKTQPQGDDVSAEIRLKEAQWEVMRSFSRSEHSQDGSLFGAAPPCRTAEVHCLLKMEPTVNQQSGLLLDRRLD